MKAAAALTSRMRGVSRARIVEVSRDIVESEGVDELTIRRIAERIDRTQPAVYQHFASKDDLLAALVVEGFTALTERLGQAARRAKNAPLAAVAKAYLGFGMERPRLYEVMFAGTPAIAFAAGAATPKPARAAFLILATAVSDTSGLNPGELESATEVVWGALHGLVMLSITGRLRAGPSLERSRLKLLTAAIGAMAGR